MYQTAIRIRDVFDLHPERAIRDGTNSEKMSAREFKWSPEDADLMNTFAETLVPGKCLLERSMERVKMAVIDTLYESLHKATKQEQLERELRNKAQISKSADALKGAA